VLKEAISEAEIEKSSRIDHPPVCVIEEEFAGFWLWLGIIVRFGRREKLDREFWSCASL